MEVADRIVVMNEGRIEQVGHPEEVYEHPATPFVYSFLGNVNLFHGRVAAGRAEVAGQEVAVPDWAAGGDRDAVAYVRTYEVELAKVPNGSPAIETVLRHVRRFGPMVRLELDRVEDGQVIEAEVPRARFEELGVGRGERVYVKPRSARLFPR